MVRPSENSIWDAPAGPGDLWETGEISNLGEHEMGEVSEIPQKEVKSLTYDAQVNYTSILGHPRSPKQAPPRYS